MTDEQVGKYIRLMCLQHMKGELTEKDMLFICKTYDEDIWNKFERTEAGTFLNRRLQEVVEKRKNYSESRRKNRAGKTKDVKNTSITYDNHMGNGNGNEIVKEKKGGAGVKKRKPFVPPTKEEVIQYFQENGYSKDAAERAFLYYDSRDWHNRDNKKVDVWKSTMISTWFKPENKEPTTTSRYQTYNPDIHK